MRSISFLTLLVLTLIGTTYGDVTITATDAGGGKLRIGYQATGTLAPVAFALDIQLNNGATFSSVTPITQAFYYYPGRFRDYINPQNPNWQDSHYLPVAPHYDPAALGGLGTSGITIETASMLSPYLANGSPADLNSDGIIDIMDLALFSNEWLTNGAMADLYSDGLVNFRDYAVFLDGHFNPVPAYQETSFIAAKWQWRRNNNSKYLAQFNSRRHCSRRCITWKCNPANQCHHNCPRTRHAIPSHPRRPVFTKKIKFRIENKAGSLVFASPGFFSF